MAGIDITNLVNRLGAPIASNTSSTTHGFSTGLGIKAPKPATGFGAYAKNLGKSVVNIGGAAAGAVGHALAEGPVGLYNDASHNLRLGAAQGKQQATDKALQHRQDTLTRGYKTGAISKSDYHKGLVQLGADSAKAHTSQVKLNKDTQDNYAGYGQVAKHAAQTVGTAATLIAPELVAVKGVSVAAKVANAGSKAFNASVGAKRGNLATKAVLNTIGTQPTVNQPFEIAKNLKDKNYTAAAGNTALLAAPLGIGAAAKALPKVAAATKQALIGKEGVLDTVFGSKALKEHIAANPDDLQRLKRAEIFTTNQPAVKSGKQTPAEFLTKHLQGIGQDPKTGKLDIGSFLKNNDKYFSNSERLAGHSKDLVVSHDFTNTVPAISKVLSKVGDLKNMSLADRTVLAQKTVKDIGIENPTLNSQVGEAVLSANSGKEAAQALENITQKHIVTTPKGLLDKGYIATNAPKDRAAIPTLAESTGDLALGKKALPGFGTVGTGLKKAGLGIGDYNSAHVGVIKDNFATAIEGKNIPQLADGKKVLEGLDELANFHKVGDFRQLKIGELEQKFRISRAEAKTLRGSLDDAFRGAPLSKRGIAGKIQDNNIKFNPFARMYARAQSFGRYRTPHFKAQQTIEANALGATVSGGSKFKETHLKDTLSKMEASGFLPKQGTGFAGESIENTAGLPRVTNHIQPSEERALARTLLSIADRDGRTVDDLLQDEKTRQLLRTVVQHSSKGIGSSNMAKALNVAFFPLAYNAKVTSLAAKGLAKQPPAVQFGVLKGISDFNEFQKSDAGIKWKADNSELINLVNYFTPINSISSIYRGISTANPGELGVIGGLPFGIISRALEGQGLKPRSTPPYVDPKTGFVAPDKIPTDLSGRLKQFLTDFVDTLYTYPGRQAGLGSKSDLTNTLTGGALKPLPGQFKEVDNTSKLKPNQRNQVRVLQAPSTPKVQLPVRKETKYLSSAPTFNNPKLPAPIAKSKTLKGPRAKNKAFRPRPL